MKSFTRLILTTFALLTLTLSSYWAQVSVTATGGTTTGTYGTISDAFGAINAGTHQGAITITITADITEPLIPNVLGPSSGTASYTSVLFKPQGDRIVTQVPCTPLTSANYHKAIIMLGGATNVTIDGDDPLTPGVKNLTLQQDNSSTSTSPYRTCVRIASETNTTGPCDNVTVKNTIMYGARNSLTHTGVTYCVAVCQSQYTYSGHPGADNITIENNEMYRVRDAIFVYGTSAAPCSNIKILNNIIGGTQTGLDNISRYGIYLNYVNDATMPGYAIVEGNRVRIGSDDIATGGFSSTVYGVYLGTGVKGTRVIRNNLQNIYQSSTGGWGAHGIYVGGSTNSDSLYLQNNMISCGATKYSTSNTTSYQANAMSFRAGATNLFVTNNTMVVEEAVNQTTANYVSAVVYMVSGNTFEQFNNNILVNLNVGAGTRGVYSANVNNVTTAWNNNNYYVPNGHIGYYAGSDQTTFANWQSATSADLNSFNVNPTFVSANDLHLTTAATPLESAGQPVTITGVTVDIDGDVRPGPVASINGGGLNPDIGADEVDATPIFPPTLTFTSINAQDCNTAVAHTVVVESTPASGTLSSVELNYSFDGVAQTPITMTNTSGNTFTGVIPVGTPVNAVVTWSVVATNSFGLVSMYVGTPYQDQSLLGITASATNSASPVCSGASSDLTVVLSGLNAPIYTLPTVSSPTNDEDFGSITISQSGTTLLTNTSTINSLTGTLGTATGTAGGYSDFTSFGSTALNAGQTYDISVSSLTTGTGYTNHMRVWIDFNRNGSFADPGEGVYASPTGAGAHTETGTITIPASALNGLTRMRVMAYENTAPSLAYINAISWGEYEDYLLNIVSTNNGGGLVPAITASVWSNSTATVVGSTNPATINPTATDSYTALVTAAGCTVTSSATTVEVLALPAAPTATASSQCGSAVPTASVASAAGAAGSGSFYWYDAASAGNLIQLPPVSSSWTTFFNDDFSGATVATGADINGSANLTNVPGWLELTAAAGGLNGGITVAAGVNAPAYKVEFDVQTTSGGADGFSWSFSPDGSATSTSPAAEMGTGSAVKISFDAYGGMPNGAGTYLLYNSTATSFNATSPGVLAYDATTPWLGSTSAHVIITINELGELTMSVDGTNIFTNVALPAGYLAEDKSTWTHIVKARTGGLNMLTAIDNLNVSYKSYGAGESTYAGTVGSTTTFYVSELGTNGCYSPLSPVLVTVVDPNPIVLTNGLNPTYCEGFTYTETATSAASPAYSFTWDANDVNSGLPASTAGASVTTTPIPGTYTIYLTGTNGVCTAVDTITLTINPNPIITSATSTAAVCTGDTVQIAAESIPAVPGTVTLGTGTTGNGTTSWPSPYGNWYWGAKQQFLFTAAELSALNVLPGAITSVAFDVTAQSTAAGFTDYAVSMGNSSVTALTTTFETGLTQVYYNAYLQPSGLGYSNNTITFQTPFVWDGTSNVVVEICFNNNGYTNNAVATYTNSFTGASHYRYADATGVCAYTDGGFLSANRTNMMFGADAIGTNFTSSLNWLWSVLNVTTPTTSNVEFNTTSAPTTTTYTVTATYPTTQCFSTATTNVTTVNILPTVSAGQDVLICSNNGTEQLTLNGSGADTYVWDNGVVDGVAFAIGANGTYIVAGTDVNGCVNVDTMAVIYSTIPLVNAGVDQGICIGDTTALAATGLAPFTWNNGVVDGIDFAPGATANYVVSVVNGVGCANSDTVEVIVNPLPTVDAGVDQTICNASPVTLAGSGALSFAWDNGVTNATPFFPSATATYTVTGTDANGCQNQDQVMVYVLPQPIVNAGLDQSVCDGTPVILNASTTSATPTPVTAFQWSNNVPNNTQFVPTNSAVLTVTATGANGCTNQDQMTLTVLALPTVNAGLDFTVCAGLSATLNASGAVSYAWNNGVTQGIPFYPNVSQTYTVVGTGSNGCTNNDDVVVTVSTGPTVNLSAAQTVCANAPATFSAAVQNSLGGFWTTSNGLGIISPNVTNGSVTYTPNVNDPVVVNLTYVATNACGSSSQNTTVTVLPIPTVDAGPDFAVCQGSSATLTATGSGFLTWTTPNVTNGVAFIPTATATYNVVATGFNNCTNNDQVTVTVLALPDVNAGSDQTICSGESVTLNGEGAVSYQWTGGVANAVAFTPSSTGTYTVTGTGVNGCENTDQVTVVVNATPVATISFVNDVTLAASPAGMNYQWINCASGTDVPNGSTSTYTAIANGSYAVIVTSAEGCSDQSDCEIIEAVGLDQIANIEMSVNPNPTAGELTINMPTELTATAQVFDAQGKLVLDATNISNGSVLNLTNMTTGVYMVRIFADSSVQTFRIVKQ